MLQSLNLTISLEEHNSCHNTFQRNFAMSTKTLATLSATLLLCASALAQTAGGFTGPSEPATASASARAGFNGPMTVVSAEQAKTLKDDTPVTLRGQIERHLGGDDYLFRDSSGTIEVEIDQRRWNGQSVSPQDKVEISGELDKHFTSSKVDVKRLHKR